MGFFFLLVLILGWLVFLVCIEGVILGYRIFSVRIAKGFNKYR